MSTNFVRSYGDVSKKESVVLNAVEILTAKETMIFNMLGKTNAIDTVHSYLTDTLNKIMNKVHLLRIWGV